MCKLRHRQLHCWRYQEIVAKTMKTIMFSSNLQALFMSKDPSDYAFMYDIDSYSFVVDECKNLVIPTVDERGLTSGQVLGIDAKNVSVTDFTRDLKDKPIFGYRQDPDNDRPVRYETVKVLRFNYDGPLRKRERECFRYIWQRSKKNKNASSIAKLSKRLAKDITEAYTFVDTEWYFNPQNTQFKRFK